MLKISKKYKVVILDFVKTLVKERLEWDKLREANAKIFKKYGINIQPQHLRPVIEQTASQLYYLKHLKFSNKKILQIERELLKAHEKFEEDSIGLFSLYTDTIPFLNYATKHNLRIGILTNNFSSTVSKVLSRLKVPFKGPIIGREHVRLPKPNPEGIVKLSKLLNINADNCFVIGDSDFDIDAAKQINSLSIFIKRTDDFKLSYMKPDHTINSLSEIIIS